MTRSEYRRVVDRVARMWPFTPLNAEAVEEGERVLLRMDYDDVEAALRSIQDDGERFAPNIGQIARRARELVAPVNKDRHCAACAGLGFTLLNTVPVRALADERWAPCSACNPASQVRWADGHYLPDHDPHACSVCRADLGLRGAAR